MLCARPLWGGGGQTFSHPEGKHFYTGMVQAFYDGCSGGYDDVDEEIGLSKNSFEQSEQALHRSLNFYGLVGP